MPEGLIKTLPPEVIGQIAAGEVVERPASAIKELVENAIDAGATSVTVDIRDGGVTSFRVTDNGSGIRPEDIRMAFMRHATSKIRTAGDLYGVRSLGFRGEALASIAAVARVTCLTRTKGSEWGVKAVNEGGQMGAIEDAACPEGTSFTVKDLFFNAPVRRKFLKKASAETALVSDLMERMILSRPDISFRFSADGKNVYFSPGDGKLENAVLSVFGLYTLRLMVPVHGTQSGILLNGLVGTGDASRGNRSREYFFLNGRTMRSGILSGALEDACRQLVTIGRFPVCVLHLEMPFENVDVNVHPNKWEVRFADETQVRSAVRDLISDALDRTRQAEDRIPQVFVPSKGEDEKKPPVPIIAAESVHPGAGNGSVPSPRAGEADGTLPRTPVPADALTARESVPSFAPAMPERMQAAPIFTAPVINTMLPLRQEAISGESPKKDAPSPAPEIEQTEDSTVREAFAGKPVRIIGTVFDTYILLEYDDRLLLCDQHAVHERLLYEKLMKETGSGTPPVQSLLSPLLVRLTRSEYETFLNEQESLYQVGFDAEDFGDLTVRLMGVPLILGQPQAAKCFREALDDLSDCGNVTELERIQRITQMSCKHAVKGGEKLPPDALEELVRRMLSEDIRLTCPHGRPLMIELTRSDLEKRFKRIQPRDEE